MLVWAVKVLEESLVRVGVRRLVLLGRLLLLVFDGGVVGGEGMMS